MQCIDSLYDAEMDISQWIRAARKHAKMSQARLGELVNTSKQNVSHWENKRNDPSIDQLLAVRRETGYPLPDDFKQETKGLEPFSNVAPADMGARPIPVISSIQAGRLREISDPYPPGAGSYTIYTNTSVSKWAFALEIEGLSMTPEYQPGDVVIIDPEVQPGPGDCVAAKNGNEEATFKKYRPRGMDKNGNMIFELVPLNQDYPTLRSDVEHLVIIGTEVERRRFKRR